jgi:hypothetical protein
MEMNINEVSTQSTYPLASAGDLLKEWAMQKLKSIVPLEDILDAEPEKISVKST